MSPVTIPGGDMRRLAFLCAALAFGCGDDSMVMFPDTGPGGVDAGGGDGCPSGTALCDMRCTNVTSDANNCGGCGVTCAAGEVCSRGSCDDSCPGDLTQCGESCVDLDLSVEHCGLCDRECSPAQVCSGGSCVCQAGASLCGDECVDVGINPAHCGVCDRACEDGEVCVDGSCRIGQETECDDGVDDDDDGDTDCEDADCNGFTQECVCDGLPDTMGMQTCEGGSFGACGPCVPPECTGEPGSDCDLYGYECVDGSCVFDDDALFDVLLVNVDVPATNLFGNQWDCWGTPSRAPDVLVYMSTASLSGETPMSDTVSAPAYRSTIGERLLRGVRAGELMEGLRITVTDDDGFWDECTGDAPSCDGMDNIDDCIGDCTFTIEEDQLNGRTQLLDCVRGSTAGFRARVQFSQGTG